MSPRALVAAGALAMFGCGHEPTGAKYEPSASCSLRSLAEWEQFLRHWASQPSWGTTCSDASNCDELTGEFATQVQEQMQSTLAECRADLEDNPRLSSCMDRLQRFSAAWSAQHDQLSHGFAPSSAAYLAAQSAPDVPEGMMTPPAELLAAWPDLDAIEAAAREHGWPYLEHESCLGGLRAFFNVVDAAAGFEQWFLFGFEPGEPLPASTIVSFLAIQQRAADGARLPQARVHFRDYLLLGTPGGGSSLELPTTSGGKCFACHPSGVRQLAPFAGNLIASAPVAGEPDYGAEQTESAGHARLEEFQQRLASYGLPDWQGAVVPADHGPALGAELGCTACHDNTTRGALSVLTSEGTLHQQMVGRLSMRSNRNGALVPDARAMALLERETTGQELTSQEAGELARSRAEHAGDYRSLVDQRLPALTRWLGEQPCDSR